MCAPNIVIILKIKMKVRKKRQRGKMTGRERIGKRENQEGIRRKPVQKYVQRFPRLRGGWSLLQC